MKRVINALAALGAALAFGCAGADATTVDPTTDPTYLPEHPDAEMRFDAEETTLVDEPSFPDDLPGPLGLSQQHFNTCWSGPGKRVLESSINKDNVPTFLGPCYEQFAAPNTSCVFPNFNRSFNVTWANENFPDNCTIGKIGGLAGHQPLGSIEEMQAVDAWKTLTGIPFTFTGSGQPHVISFMCDTPADQAAHSEDLAAGAGWGPIVLASGQLPQLSSSQIAALQPGSFFTIGNPNKRYMYGGGAMWVNDRNQNDYINNQCGGTAAQRLNKAKSLDYAIMVHEFGHILGLSHTVSGVMKPRIPCSDFGDGSVVVKPTINPAYGAMFDFYESQLTGGTPFGSCTVAAPLEGVGTQDAQESDRLN